MDSAHLSSHVSPVRDAVTSPCDCGKKPLRPSRAVPELFPPLQVLRRCSRRLGRTHPVTPHLFATRSQASATAEKKRYGPHGPSRNFSLRSRSCAAAHDGSGALIQSRLTASATGDKSLLAKNAALTTTRREPSCARLLAYTPLRAQCRQRLFFCSGPRARLRRVGLCTRLRAQCSAVSIRRFFQLCRKND